MKKKSKIIISVVLSCVVIVIGIVAGIFYGEIKTILSMEADTETGIYNIDYAADYKLDQLLEEGGVNNEDELAKYILRIMLKGLPIKIEYSVPELACSTFIAETPEKGYIFGRNLDNQVTDLAVVKTNPKNGYKSISVVNLSFLGYNETYTPEKILDRIVTLGSAYFPLDGINEKGLAIGVLQLQAPPTNQQTDKVDIGTTLAIRILLDKAATVKEAVDMLKNYDMHASANGCFHIQIADATGASVVVSYVNNEMVVTKMEGNYQAATNFYLHDVPFEYEKQGEDRYEILVTNLQKKNGILTPEEGMNLLHKASLTDTEPDEEGRVYSTQWSALYDLTKKELTLCVDRNYETKYTYTFDK